MIKLTANKGTGVTECNITVGTGHEGSVLIMANGIVLGHFNRHGELMLRSLDLNKRKQTGLRFTTDVDRLFTGYSDKDMSK